MNNNNTKNISDNLLLLENSISKLDLNDVNTSWLNNSLFIMPQRSYFELKIYISPENNDLKEQYIKACNEHNNVTLSIITGNLKYFDAGFDLYCPENISCDKNSTTKINHKVQCSMVKVKHDKPIGVHYNNGMHILKSTNSGDPVGYYLYPRSSTGTKTPLRLANSVGIIDSGYRGDLIAAFDNNSKKKFDVVKNQRLVQVCPPELTSPIYVILVDSVEELGETIRGKGGFGSTGV